MEDIKKTCIKTALAFERSRILETALNLKICPRQAYRLVSTDFPQNVASGAVVLSALFVEEAVIEKWIFCYMNEIEGVAS